MWIFLSRFVSGTLVLATLSGCATMPSYQSAETLRPGDTEWGAQWSIGSLIRPQAFNSDTVIPTVSWVQTALRTGISSRIDAGADLGLLNAQGRIRYELAHSSASAASLGLTGGWRHEGFGLSSLGGDFVSTANLGLILYRSHRWNDHSEVTWAPGINFGWFEDPRNLPDGRLRDGLEFSLTTGIRKYHEAPSRWSTAFQTAIIIVPQRPYRVSVQIGIGEIWRRRPVTLPPR